MAFFPGVLAADKGTLVRVRFRPYGIGVATDASMEEEEAPESAFGVLFASYHKT